MYDEAQNIRFYQPRPDIAKGVNGTILFFRRFTGLYDLYSFYDFRPEIMDQDDKKYLKLKIDNIAKQQFEDVQDDLEHAKNDKDRQTLKHFSDEMNGIKNDIKKLFYLN